MVIDKQKLEKYPNAIEKYATHVGFPVEILGDLSFDCICKFFDDLGLFIGITCDADGIFWIPEVCSVPLHVVNSREAAEDMAIEECFKMLEEMLNCEIK